MIRINNFGGPLVWLLRKYVSNLTSRLALSYAAKKYAPAIRAYMELFQEKELQSTQPLFLNCMIETMNRCNGTCAFCPANRKDEKRPFKKMSFGLYPKIINELKDLNWRGKLFLNVNNEPFLDTRILDFARYAKNKISDVFIEIISNGTLLTPPRYTLFLEM